MTLTVLRLDSYADYPSTETFLKDCIYLIGILRSQEREDNIGRGRSRLPLKSELKAGLNPRTLGSGPEPKAEA